jgi:hypothetical protein
VSFIWFADKPLRTREQIAREVHAVSLSRGLDEFATVLALMCIAVEVGAQDSYGEQQWWCPWNEADPESKNFPYDSQSDDGRSVGYFQQQKGPKGELWWGTSGDEMTLAVATNNFLERLDDSYSEVSDALSAGEFVANVQQCNPLYRHRYSEKWDEAHDVLSRALKLQKPTVVVKPTPVAKPATPVTKPKYTELDRFGRGFSERTRKPINFFWHTQEGNGTAESLAEFCNGDNNVSYHYTLRDNIICNIVDTDYYSWSVLDANVFSINLCFAGSYAGWSREQWLQREKDIEIAAYITVQDCKKYGIPLDVIAPPYGKPRPGISDHKYVTQALGIGTHTDVGDQFPWDRAKYYVEKFSRVAAQTKKDDWMSNVDTDKLNRAVEKILQQYNSRSMFRDSDSNVDDAVGMLLNSDATVYDVLIMIRAFMGGDPEAVARIRRLANGKGPAGKESKNVQIAKALWTKISDEQKKAAASVKVPGE